MQMRHILLFVYLTASSLFAEPYILKEGPILAKGLPLDTSNSFESWYGVYSIMEIHLEVWVYLEDFVVLEDWDTVSLCRRTFYTYSDLKDRKVYYIREAGSSFFFVFQEEWDICEFLPLFLERYVYFRGLKKFSGQFILPAVLNP